LGARYFNENLTAQKEEKNMKLQQSYLSGMSAAKPASPGSERVI
jgi:hypothetical protein